MSNFHVTVLMQASNQEELLCKLAGHTFILKDGFSGVSLQQRQWKTGSISVQLRGGGSQGAPGWFSAEKKIRYV